MAAASRSELAPPSPELGPEPKLLFTRERVEDVELVGGPGETALLELAGHRDQPLAGRREILARGASAPRVRAGPPVGEHAPRQHEPLFALGLQLGEGLQALFFEQAGTKIELGL